MKVPGVLAVLALSMPLTGSGQPEPLPVLISETVRLDAQAGRLRVTGQYLFCSRDADRDVKVLFPIPDGLLLRTRRSVVASIRCDRQAKRQLDLEMTAMGPTWMLPFSRCDTCQVDIRYEQAVSASRAEYPLTTARGWCEPIGWARFEIRLPPGAELTRSSYALTGEGMSRGSPVYTYEERDFSPDRDLIVEWREAEER